MTKNQTGVYDINPLKGSKMDFNVPAWTSKNIVGPLDKYVASPLLSTPKTALDLISSGIYGGYKALSNPEETGQKIEDSINSIGKKSQVKEESKPQSPDEVPYEPYAFGGGQNEPSIMNMMGSAPQTSAAVQSAMDMKDSPKFPEFNTKRFGEAAEAAGRGAQAQGQRENDLNKANANIMQGFSDLTESKIEENNKMYTDWMQSSKESAQGLNELQAKYPALSRADVMSNMSTGQKIVSALLMIAGSQGGRVPIEQNGAMNVFNRGLDEMIAKQKINYDRERQNVLDTKLFNDDTFKIGLSKVKSDYDMNANLTKNALAIASAKANQTSDQELKDKYTLAKDNIMLKADEANFNYQTAVYQSKMMERQYQMQAQLEAGKSHMIVKIPITKEDSVTHEVIVTGYENYDGFLANDADREKIGANIQKNNDIFEDLNNYKTAINTGNTSQMDFYHAKLVKQGLGDIPSPKNFVQGLYSQSAQAGVGAINSALVSNRNSSLNRFESSLRNAPLKTMSQ